MKELPGKIALRIKIFFRKFQVIPEMEEKRKVIEYYRELFKPKVLIETGTLFGDTIEYFKNRFSFLISIELSEELAARAALRFEGDKHVKIIQGNSNVVLSSLLTDVESPVLFWLDGHYSSDFFYREELISTAKGEKDTPIEEELDIILRSTAESIILIDDARLFNGKNDYPTINTIKKRVKSCKMNSKVFVKKDIIHIIPKSK